MSSKTTNAYRLASAEGATQIGLMVIVYDAIAFEIQAAGAAASRGDIEARCQASNKALLLLGHLESWSERLEESALISGITLFYSTVRARLLHLQVHSSQSDFHQLSEMVLAVRVSWQEKEQQLTSRMATPPVNPYPNSPAETGSVSLGAMRWSA